MKKNIFKNFPLALILLLTACLQQERLIQSNFATFTYVHYAKNFPNYSKTIKNCETTKTSECRIYNYVLDATEILFGHGRDSALSSTLYEIKNNCMDCKYLSASGVTEDEQIMVKNCLGALIALYFFQKEHDDSRILNFFRKNSNILKKVFHPHSRPKTFTWFYNRPLKKQWLILIDSLQYKNIDQNNLFNPFNSGEEISLFHKRRMEVLDTLLAKISEKQIH